MLGWCLIIFFSRWAKEVCAYTLQHVLNTEHNISVKHADRITKIHLFFSTPLLLIISAALKQKKVRKKPVTASFKHSAGLMVRINCPPLLLWRSCTPLMSNVTTDTII